MFTHLDVSEAAGANGVAAAGAWITAARAQIVALAGLPHHGNGFDGIMTNRRLVGAGNTFHPALQGATPNTLDWRVPLIVVTGLPGSLDNAGIAALPNPADRAAAAVAAAEVLGDIFGRLNAAALGDFQTYYNNLADGRGRNRAAANTGNSDSRTGLTYILADTPWPHDPPGARHARTEADSVVQVELMRGQKHALTVLGHRRFHSAFVRNLFFITNVYRLTRAKLNHELAQQRTIIQRGNSLVSSAMTEYDSDPRTGPGERAAQREFYSERSMLHG